MPRSPPARIYAQQAASLRRTTVLRPEILGPAPPSQRRARCAHPSLDPCLGLRLRESMRNRLLASEEPRSFGPKILQPRPISLNLYLPARCNMVQNTSGRSSGIRPHKPASSAESQSAESSSEGSGPGRLRPGPGSSGQRSWLRLGGLGIELAGAVAGFTLLGYWIDRHYGTSPWGLLICAICGLIGGFRNFIRSSLKALTPPGPPGRRLKGSISASESQDDPKGND